jgi:hypothetical protein
MSYTTLEHIPEEILRGILREGNRIVRPEGLFIHCIDYSDHFWHSDKSIPPINFLRYSDNEWDRYADNASMYMNRLRHDDFVRLFREAGHRLLKVEPQMDPQSYDIVRSGRFRIDTRFRGKPDEVLSTINSLIISQNLGEPIPDEADPPLPARQARAASAARVPAGISTGRCVVRST